MKDIVPSPNGPNEHLQNKDFLENSSLNSLSPVAPASESKDSCVSIPVTSPSTIRYPILFVDVNLGGEQVERLTVLEGDTSQEVADKFCKDHGLNPNLCDKLKNMLDDQMNGILSRINEEEEQGPDFSPRE